MSVRDSVRALADLGFTNLEAEIYSFLLQESPATGYRIAQAIGKPAANTYKAIQTLEQKGAVIVEDGSTRNCRAISSEELLSRLSREFEKKRASALSSLSTLNNPTVDERIYQIRSKDQVLQRAREMLAGAKQVALAAIPSSLVPELADAFLEAAASGVDAAIKSDQAIRIEGVESVVAADEERELSSLQLSVDCEEALSALYDVDGQLIQAIWTRSPAVVVGQHEGLASQICLVSVADRIEEGAGQKRLSRAVGSLRTVTSTPGYERLSGKD
jgi:sugar-specific transcriptional regulator TrmB